MTSLQVQADWLAVTTAASSVVSSPPEQLRLREKWLK
jgi:hypothetical protein